MPYMSGSKQAQFMNLALKNSRTGLPPTDVNDIVEYYYKTGDYYDSPQERITAEQSRDIINELKALVEDNETESDIYT